MVALGAGLVEDQTPIEPAPYGLLSPAATVIEGDGRWTGGFNYETRECLAATSLTAICAGSVTATAVNRSGDLLYRNYLPFAVTTDFKCSTFGNTPDDIREQAREYTRAGLQKSAEYEFWTGALAKAAAEDDSWNTLEDGEYPNRYLASENAVDVTPTPGTGVRSKQALALLEQALADSGLGVRGTIHATREVASVLGLPNDDDRLTTKLGNYVIAGTGYTGSGPDGTLPTAPGHVWMYATGPVTVRVGDPESYPTESNQSVDIRNNTIQYYSDQIVAVTWNNCAHFAVLVDLNLDYA